MIIQFSRPKKKKETTKLVKLVKHITPKSDSYFSYTDLDNIEKPYIGEYTKSNNSYYFVKTIKHKHIVDCEITHETKHINSHFTYIDKDGFERVFNKLDSLECINGSYFGDIEEVEYINHEVELFEEK